MQGVEKTRVDLTGLMRVLGEALYSTPQVAIRELVQNAHDSCARRLLESGSDFSPRITVSVEPGSLLITDTGAGLTREEIHAYLATVGSGYTRVLRDQGKGDSLIGYFGLGFLSAFAVSERVEVWTASYREPTVAHRFISRNGETYSVETAASRPVGTEVRLALRPQFAELADARVVAACLQRYCCLLTYPVVFGNGAAVNAGKPPWRLDSTVSPTRLRALSLEFARRFESQFEPITTLPLRGENVEGILWIQDGSTYASSDNRQVAVYVRGMLIGEDERELLPRWAGFVSGVIESIALRPTASRETLQKDDAYQHAASAVHRSLLDGLATIAKEDRQTWRRILSRHNESLLGAALSDAALYELVASDLTIPTTEGAFTLKALLHRCRGKLYITQSEHAGMEAMLFRALRMPVVLGHRYAALPYCHRYVQQHGGQVVLLGTAAGDQWLFQPSPLLAAHEARLRDWLGTPDREVLVRHFAPAHLPFVLITDRDVELKRRLESDLADQRMGQGILSLARLHTQKITASASTRMYVNAANPIILALLEAEPARRTLALSLLQPLLLVTADASVQIDAEASLEQFGQALLQLLRGS
jgi:molecular chaperone HtpG